MRGRPKGAPFFVIDYLNVYICNKKNGIYYKT